MFNKTFRILILLVFALGTSSLSFGMSCGGGKEGHSSHQKIAQLDSGHKHDSESSAIETTLEEAVDVGNEICPVSGEKIDQKMKATYEYEGKIYNFCCQMCIDEFKKDPQKYIDKVKEELKGDSQKETKEEPMQGAESSPKSMPESHHH